MINTIGIIAGLFLTVCVYSYIFKDNVLYRLAVHILVGVSAAYAAVVVVRAVIAPAIFSLAGQSLINLALGIAPIILGMFLLLPRNRSNLVRNSGVAVLVGIGAAVALVGAIAGTLLPQTTSVGGTNPVVGMLSAIFTISTLLYFQFVIRPLGDETTDSSWLQRFFGQTIGRAVIMITFGVLFATTLNTSLALLTAQLDGIYQSVSALIR